MTKPVFLVDPETAEREPATGWSVRDQHLGVKQRVTGNRREWRLQGEVRFAPPASVPNLAGGAAVLAGVRSPRGEGRVAGVLEQQHDGTLVAHVDCAVSGPSALAEAVQWELCQPCPSNDEVYERFGKFVLGQLRRLEVRDIEDALHTVFENLFAARRDGRFVFQSIPELIRYLEKGAAGVAKAQSKVQSKVPRPENLDPRDTSTRPDPCAHPPSADPIARELEERIVACLSRVEVIAMGLLVKGLSISEIAQVLGKTRNAVDKILQRARKKIGVACAEAANLPDPLLELARLLGEERRPTDQAEEGRPTDQAIAKRLGIPEKDVPGKVAEFRQRMQAAGYGKAADHLTKSYAGCP